MALCATQCAAQYVLRRLTNSCRGGANGFVAMAGIVILIGHYLDVFNMIMPATVGDRWSVGLPELSALALFSGLFLLLVFYALSKHPLLPKGNPFIKESEHFHY